MAFLNPCDLDNEIVNTGTECNDAMGPTAMIILGDPSIEYTPQQIAGGMLAVLQADTHESGRNRIFPIFGNNVPVRDIQNTNEDNILETMPDGSTAFVRSGKFTRLFATKEGGDCLSKAFYRLNGSSLGFIEVDGNNKVKMRKLANGNYSFIPTNMIDAPLPTLADYAVVFKNAIRLNFDPKFYIAEAVTFQSDEDLLSLRGLVNAEITQGATTITTTKLYINVASQCGSTDLIEEFPTEIVEIDNFIVFNVTDNAAVTPSAAAIVSGQVELTVTAQTSADVIRVTGAAASVLSGNGIDGFDIVKGCLITIP
jgi:hypothetical protein